jgi:hypothetical protein
MPSDGRRQSAAGRGGVPYRRQKGKIKLLF